MAKHRNHGLRKVCSCARSHWPKCRHGWYFNFKLPGQPGHRFSLDRYLGKHIATKGDAEVLAANLRAQILNGEFQYPAARPAAVAVATTLDTPVTIAQLGARYVREYVSSKTNAVLSRDERYRWDLIMRTEIERANGLRVAFGDLPITSITRHDLEAFKAAQRTVRTMTCTDAKGRSYQAKRGGMVSVNRCLGRLRNFFMWAVDADHLVSSPFKKGDVTKVKMFSEAERERRLAPGEESALLEAANPHLGALIVAALETSCRLGELLSLQWMQVRWDLNELHLPGKKTKARRPRYLPMSQCLRAVLEMRRHDADGKEYPAAAFVFGDATGARIRSVKTAWENCRLVAHGVDPVRDPHTSRLTPACRQKLAEINLRFHDLRREAGSRFLEHGMAANYVQKFLDHANLSTTSRYLKIERQGMHAALKTFERTRTRNLRATNPLAAPEKRIEHPH